MLFRSLLHKRIPLLASGTLAHPLGTFITAMRTEKSGFHFAHEVKISASVKFRMKSWLQWEKRVVQGICCCITLLEIILLICRIRGFKDERCKNFWGVSWTRKLVLDYKENRKGKRWPTCQGRAEFLKSKKASIAADLLLTNPLNSVAKLKREGWFLKLNFCFVHNFWGDLGVWQGVDWLLFLIYKKQKINYLIIFWS